MTSDKEKGNPSNSSVFETKISSLNVALPATSSLGTRVYEFLREQLRSEKLKPGTEIQTAELAKILGVSKTPLRDALIQLQSEGFLRILPQKGVIINSLDAKALQELIQVLGALESQALMLAFPKLGEREIAFMSEINGQLLDLLPKGASAYLEYNKLNIAFHDVFLNVCGNKFIVDQIRLLKDRMYHFPDRDYGDRWRSVNVEEHQILIKSIIEGEALYAASFMRDVHWTFDLNKPVIDKLNRL